MDGSGETLPTAAAAVISYSHAALFLSGRKGEVIKEELDAAHHMGPIGSKICYEDVSRDDPKQTIDSRSPV